MEDLSVDNLDRNLHLNERLFDQLTLPARQLPVGEKMSVPNFSNSWKSFYVRCQAGMVRKVRVRILELCKDVPFSSQEREDVCLAVGEAIANAFRHGCRWDEGKWVHVRCATEDGRLVVEMADPGDGFDPEAILDPDLNEFPEGGMGIHLMRLVMDEVSYTFDSSGTTVRLIKTPSRRSEKVVA
jgi:anti-sigma regulatory factor (Ser/Thr protein kinase)